jgi:arylformamidase
MRRWIDVSLPLANDSVVWPGDLPVVIRRTMCMEKGEICNESRFELGSHAGTHMDAPRHFVPSGATVDNLDPEILVGPAWVLESSASRVVSAEEIALIPEGECRRVILKTRNSAFLGQELFREDYVGLDPEEARLLVRRGCQLVGIDYYSICPFDDLITTHHILLEAGVYILESLLLREVWAGPVDLIALPLKIQNGDAAPTRVLIRERN